jgi:hypothetical protein
MTIRSTGFYRPGAAGGTHSGYPQMGSQYRGGGFLGQLGNYRNQMAQMQLAMMREQLKQSELARKMQVEEFMRNRTRGPELKPLPPWATAERMYNLQKQDRDARAKQMAEALYSHPHMSGRQDPLGRQRIHQMIQAIGPEAAHAGLMQSGRLFAGQTGSPDQSAYGNRDVGGFPVLTTVQTGTTAEGVPAYGQVQTGETPYAQIGGMKRGTLPGTVPKTGKALIHEGEVVVPKEQVDRPLLHYLMADAMEKGVPLGKGGEGYKCGSLKGYQAGTLLEGAQGDEALRRFQQLRSGTVGGFQPMIPGLEGTTPSVWPGYLQQMAGTTRPGVEEQIARMTRETEGLVDQLRQQDLPFPKGVAGTGGLSYETIQKAVDAADSADKQKLLKAARDYAYGGKAFSDDAIKAARKTKYGRALLAAAMPAVALTAMGEPRETSAMTKLLAANPLAWPGLIGAKAIEEARKGRPTSEAIGAGGGELAAALAGTAKGARDVAVDVGAGLFTGAMGPTYFQDQPTEDAAAQRVLELQQTGGGPAAEEPTPSGAPAAEPGGITGTGTKDDPYTMVGQLSEREQAYQEMRGDPGFINAKHHGDMAQAEVTKLLTLLQNHGHRMDPQVKQNTLQQLQFQSKIAGQWQARVREREKEVEDILKTGEMARQARVKEEHKQGLQTDRLLSGIEAREKAKYRTIRLGNAANVMRDLYKAWLTDKKASNRQRVEEQLFDMVEQIYEDQGRQKPSPEEITQTVRNLVFLNDETMFVMGVESLLK